VVIVSARAEDADIVIGLELGAEDYVTKPFSPTVVVSRLKAAIRRRTSVAVGEMPVIRLQRIQINPGRRQVMAGSQSVALTPSEFAVLHLLARRPGWVFSRPQILDLLHGRDYEVSERSVDYVIASLRRKLGAHSDEIQTVRGVGYRAIRQTNSEEEAG
jgi:two-component system phosphate regulon response regulator PhoB